MNISQNAVILPENTLKVHMFYVYVFSYLSLASPPLPALAEQKCFKAISENVNNTLCLSSIPSTQAVWVGGWGGEVGWVSWENTEPVIMDKPWHFLPQRGYNGHSPITVCWGLLTHTMKSTSPPCLPLPPWSARRNTLPSQTPTDEKQIQHRQRHYLTGCKWLGIQTCNSCTSWAPSRTIVDVTVAS